MKRIGSLFLAVLMVVQVFPPSSAWAMARKPSAKETARAKQYAQSTSLTLQDCYQMALRESDTLAISKEAIQVVKAEFFQATGEVLPQVDFVMNTFKQQPQPSNGSGTPTVGNFSRRETRDREFVIEQPLFQGFKALASLKAAGSLTRQKKEEYIRAQQLLFQDVAASFYEVQFQKNRLEDYIKILQVYADHLKELDKREKIGKSRLSEIAATTSQMNIKKAELEAARGLLANAVHQMEYLTGRTLKPEDLKDDEANPEKAEGYEAYLSFAETRPDVKAAFQSVRSYWSGIIEAQSGLWPQINLVNNNYVYRDGIQSTIDWDLLLKIDVPLFRGGTTVGNIKQAVSQWKQSKFVYSNTLRQAELEIKQAYDTWQYSFKSYDAYQEALRSAKENYQLQNEDYGRNLVSNLDVLTALESLFETRRSYWQSYYVMKQNYWKLKIATGECCAS